MAGTINQIITNMFEKKIIIEFYDENDEPLGGTNINDVSLEFAQGYAHNMAKEFFKDKFSNNPCKIEYTVVEHITLEKVLH